MPFFGGLVLEAQATEGLGQDPSSIRELFHSCKKGDSPLSCTRVAISHRTFRLQRAKIALALRCNARGVRVCKGKLTMQLTAATSRLRDAATGSAGYSIKAGATKALLIKAPSAGSRSRRRPARRSRS